MDWSSFLDSGAGRAVRPFLQHALGVRDESPGVAVDLGCGDGTEARYLVANGWRVHAFDGAAGVNTRVLHGVPREAAGRLDAAQLAFEDVTELPANNLIYAGRSLPFCAAAAFPKLWTAIRGSNAADGWFVGDFFGLNDSWVGREDMNFHSRAEIEELLDGFTIDSMTEAEGPASTPFGDKHMHIISVIAHRDNAR